MYQDYNAYICADRAIVLFSDVAVVVCVRFLINTLEGNHNTNLSFTLVEFDVLHYDFVAVRSRTLLQVQEEYPDEHPETIQFNLSSDYLKAAAPLTSQNTASLGEVSVEVSEIERKSQDNKIKAQKR